MRRAQPVLLLLTLLGTGAAVVAQPTPQANRGSTVALDLFVVTATEGNPIADLTTSDLTLRVGGRPRAIQSLRWVSTVNEAAPLAGAGLPAPFGTNAFLEQGRAIVIVFDDDSFRPGRERPLREAIDKFLIELSPHDRVAFATVPYGALKSDFTTNRAEVSQAVGRIVGQAPIDQTGSDFACRSRRTLESLTGLLDSLGGGQGPTTVLFVSNGLAPPRRDAPMALAPGACEITTDMYEQVGIAASGARAHFYVIRPDNDIGNPASRFSETIAGANFTGSDNPLAGLEHLAGVTGGQQLQLLTARETNLARVARETSGYYSLEFAAEQSERNGRRHPIDLRTTREGALVRARPTVIIPPPDGRVRAMPPREMLRQARVFRDLPLRVIGYPSRGERNQIKVVTLVEPVEPGTKWQDVSVALFDANGKAAFQSTASSEERASQTLMSALLVTPGNYRLRVAATDAQGRGGTADYNVAAELTAVGPLTLSGLVLGINRTTGFTPMFQFSTEPVASAYVEIYGTPSGPLAVTMELATSENNRPIIAMPAAISATKEGDRRMAVAALPIGALPPGDYIARATVVITDQSSGRVSRTLRKLAPR